MATKSSFVDKDGETEDLDFVADSPKGVVKQSGTGGSSVGGERTTAAPQKEIEKHRDIAASDPHVKEAINTLLDWVVGDGFTIRPRTFDAALEDGTGELAVDVATGGDLESGQEDDGEAVAAKLERLLRLSEFWPTFVDWIRYSAIDGHAFMELVVKDGTFQPKLLPTERMKRKTDDKGNIEQYKLERPQGGGGGDDNDITYKPHEVAELYFQKDPLEDFGRSLIEAIAEQADILRDMEIDYARFIATKAYPPILWKLGDAEKGEKWTEDQIDNWLDTIESIEPDSMLAAGDDVDFDLVGTTSTSSTAGAMRLEETFSHFQNRIVTGLGVPALIMNMEGGGGGQGEAVSAMPSFKRRVRRFQNRITAAVEQQILKSLMFNSLKSEDTEGMVPNFEFGEHSSAEERLDADKAIMLLNNGLLKPEAAARRAGIDPESELPEMWDSADLMKVLQALAGLGDKVQNPNGGSTTDTEGGTDSSGGEVTSRQDVGADSSNGRNKSSVTEDEDA